MPNMPVLPLCKYCTVPVRVLYSTAHPRLPKPQDYTATAKSIRYQVPHHRDQNFVWQIICTRLKAHIKFRLKCSTTSGQIPVLAKMRGRTSTTIHKLSCYGTTAIQAFIYLFFSSECKSRSDSCSAVAGHSGSGVQEHAVPQGAQSSIITVLAHHILRELQKRVLQVTNQTSY